jgi:uncharacterized membrane protein
VEQVIASVLRFVAPSLDALTGAAIAAGVVGALLRLVRSGRAARIDLIPEIRHHLGRWLAFALEFALAADILRSVVAPTWDDIGKLGAIAALRTLLNYFLEREMASGRALLRSRPAA